jgi:hypothetical protein
LKVSAENASEIIGKGLLDSLQVLAKDNSIENAGSAMEDFATDIANATYGMALLIAKTKEFFNLQGTSKNLGGPLSFIPIIGPLLETAAKYGATESAKPKSNFTYELGASATKDIERANKLLKTKNKLEADAIAKLKAKSEVDKLKDKFDLERIGLTLALNQATDEETKLRLRSLLAILDNNDALAKKILAEMEAAAAAKKLASDLGAVSTATIDYFQKLSESLVGTVEYFSMSVKQILDERLRESGNRSLGGGVVSSGAGSTALGAAYFQNLANQLVGTSSYSGMNVSQIATERARESGNRSVDVNLTVNSPSGDRFAQLMAESIQVAGRSGYSTAPNGGLS